MKPILGWTTFSREELRQVERLSETNEEETRDEIGFLLIHQGLADRFFPGTSVLHTRIRYALFVPWIYQRAAAAINPGKSIEVRVRNLLIELAKRLVELGKERYFVIGGKTLGRLTSQPPDHVYWPALRTWGLVLPDVETRSEAQRRLKAAADTPLLDDDGQSLNDETLEVFSGIPSAPHGWEDSDSPLQFRMPKSERDFLRRKLNSLTRPDDGRPSLLARLMDCHRRINFPANSLSLPRELDVIADDADRKALRVARDAAALAAIGRTIYGALLEDGLESDGQKTDRRFQKKLTPQVTRFGAAAGRCDLESLENLLPKYPEYLKVVLQNTQAFVQRFRARDFRKLREYYSKAELLRKTIRRARLSDTVRGAERRSEWAPDRHNTKPLHYRWRIVSRMYSDVMGAS